MAPRSLATLSVLADRPFVTGSEVGPNISTSTTFVHPLPGSQAANEPEPFQSTRHIYSRYTNPTLTRAEKVIAAVIGQPTILYPSGIAASFAALLHYQPDVIAITKGYHGCHEAILVYKRVRGNVRIIQLDDDFKLEKDEKKLLAWVETPLNPTGTTRCIQSYADKVHKIGGKLLVDSTFAPPPLQDPFKWGADCVMHSATKYFAGHSDALSGSLSVRTEAEWNSLWHDRTYTGATPGALEAWLLLRSIRTLDMRVRKQSTTATALAMWLSSLTRAHPGSALDGPANFIASVTHAALEFPSRIGEGKQMTSGPATFSIICETEFQARWLPHSLEIFTPATSLGGVESLIEQRVVSDPGENPKLVRISVGVEDFEDLKEDLINGMRKVDEMVAKTKL